MPNQNKRNKEKNGSVKKIVRFNSGIGAETEGTLYNRFRRLRKEFWDVEPIQQFTKKILHEFYVDRDELRKHIKKSNFIDEKTFFHLLGIKVNIQEKYQKIRVYDLYHQSHELQHESSESTQAARDICWQYLREHIMEKFPGYEIQDILNRYHAAFADLEDGLRPYMIPGSKEFKFYLKVVENRKKISDLIRDLKRDEANKMHSIVLGGGVSINYLMHAIASINTDNESSVKVSDTITSMLTFLSLVSATYAANEYLKNKVALSEREALLDLNKIISFDFKFCQFSRNSHARLRIDRLNALANNIVLRIDKLIQVLDKDFWLEKQIISNLKSEKNRINALVGQSKGAYVCTLEKLPYLDSSVYLLYSQLDTYSHYLKNSLCNDRYKFNPIETLMHLHPKKRIMNEVNLEAYLQEVTGSKNLKIKKIKSRFKISSGLKSHDEWHQCVIKSSPADSIAFHCQNYIERQHQLPEVIAHLNCKFQEFLNKAKTSDEKFDKEIYDKLYDLTKYIQYLDDKLKNITQGLKMAKLTVFAGGCSAIQTISGGVMDAINGLVYQSFLKMMSGFYVLPCISAKTYSSSRSQFHDAETTIAAEFYMKTLEAVDAIVELCKTEASNKTEQKRLAQIFKDQTGFHEIFSALKKVLVDAKMQTSDSGVKNSIDVFLEELTCAANDLNRLADPEGNASIRTRP